MQYILLIHHNAKSTPSAGEWAAFLARAKESGMFKGGSEIRSRQLIGVAASPGSSEHIVGFMRFDSDDKQRVLELLSHHPVVVHGGSVELCEMPSS